MSDNIFVYTYSAFTSVETLHGRSLEFVLRESEGRNSKENNYYSDQLFNAIHNRFKHDPNIILRETELYGDVSFLLQCSTNIEDLQKAIEDCKSVVNKWINKYNINKMKAR